MTIPRTRRYALKAVAAGLLTATAGCLNLEGIEGGQLTVRLTTDPPADAAVVPMADKRVSSVVILRSVTQRVSQDNPHATANLNREQYNEVAESLGDLPKYDGPPSGYYLKNGERVYRFRYAPYCTNVPGVKSQKDGLCVVGSSDSNPEPSLDRF